LAKQFCRFNEPRRSLALDFALSAGTGYLFDGDLEWMVLFDFGNLFSLLGWRSVGVVGADEDALL